MKRVSITLLIGLLLLAGQANADMRKEVSIWVARDVAPGPKVRITINTTNVPTVQIAAYRLSDMNLLMDRSDVVDVKSVSVGRAFKQWNVSLVTPKESRNPAQKDAYRSRQVNLPVLPPGAYMLIARGGGKENRAIVNVTNLAVVVKRSSRHILVWATDFESGRIIADAKVTMYSRVLHTSRDKAGKEQTTCTCDVVTSLTTRDDGTAVIQTPPSEDQTIVVSRGRDLAVIPCGNSSDDGVLKSHFQTDRPIYRPGQTVYYKAILRRTSGRGYTPVSQTSCKVAIRDSQDNVLDESNTTTNDIGTLSGQFDIPSEAAIGPYSIVVTVGENQVYETFSVAEYRKPEFKVNVHPAEVRYLSGEDVAFSVDAAYYYGSPLQQAGVSYKVRRSGAAYWGNGALSWLASDDGNLYPHDTYGSQDFIAEGTVYTDDTGKVTIPVKTKRGTPDSTYSIECTVLDASRRQVEGSSSVPVYAAGIRLGMRTDVICAALGSNIPVQLRVVDLDGKPAAAKVTLEIQGHVWDKKTEEYKAKSFGTTSVDVPAGGSATAKVPANTEGDVLITATASDATGRKTGTSITVWVAGTETKVEKVGVSKEPSVNVKLDRQAYAVGNTAKAWVTTNTLDRPLLVTAEGMDIWRYEVLRAGRSVYNWSLKTSVEMSPNAFVEVVQWTKNGLLSTGAELPIPDETRKLDVRIEPERNAYRPSEPASYTIRTTGQDGKPVSAEVAVAVVDEAIYAMRPDATPDLLTTFWASRQNAVQMQYSAPEEVSGGAYQRVNSLAPARQRFVDTAYWNAHVMTGPDGTARISFETPGNLTTWRATARAITKDTKVGTASITTKASRPIMLRLAIPRQFVKGDRLKLIGTLTNRSGAPHEFETAISAVGVRIEGDVTQKVAVPDGKEATVEWNAVADTLPESGFASITARTLATDARPDQGEELSDALKMDVRVVPDGIQHRISAGGAMGQEKTIVLNVPADRIEPASIVTVAARLGFEQVVSDMAAEVVRSGRYGSVGSADELLAIAISGPDSDPREMREALASAYKLQSSEGGWGWWGEQADSGTTAAVLSDLARARGLGLSVSDRLTQRGVAGGVRLFDGENLWERAALLASAVALTGSKDSARLLDKVHEKGRPLSPFAQLSLAEAYLKTEKSDWARESAQHGLADVVVGPEVAYVPAGDHPGWSATAVETTAQALLVAVRLGIVDDLQPKLAQWLVIENSRSWLSQHETALTAFALNAYAAEHPQSNKLGTLEVSVNGTRVASGIEKHGNLQVSVPSKMLKDGDNTFVLKRSEPGEVFYSVEARVYRPVTDESQDGMRVMRRYEVMDAAGLWSEMTGPIKPSEPVRCTVIVWPNDRPDTIRLTEPIPCAFEFIDSDDVGRYAREEVRDGAVIHYLMADGNPSFFRYYIRAESEGTVTALPAMAEAVRRPTVRANSRLTTFEVRK